MRRTFYGNMFTPTLSAEQQKKLARDLTTFLPLYKHLSDAYIIEFFSEALWDTLPVKWQQVLCDLTPPQIADLLLDGAIENRRYPSVWPLSLLAFRATAQALAFPRTGQMKEAGSLRTALPDEFLENHSQSSVLGHIFRKHVKPKKQHEIYKLGMLVEQLCNQTASKNVVDVGSGQGHLTRFLSFGLGLSVTGIEADPSLVAMASKFDGQLLWTLEKDTRNKKSSCPPSVPGPTPCHIAGWVNPKASWEAFIRQLSAAPHNSKAQTMPCGPNKKRLRASASDSKRGRVCTESESPCYKDTDAPCKKRHPQDSETHRSSPSVPNHGRDEDTAPESSPGTCYQRVPRTCDEGLCPMEEEQQMYPDFVLTGLHACGDLSATLLRHFVKCPHVQGITSVACCYMKISTKESPTPPGLVAPPLPPTPVPTETSQPEFGYPMSALVQGLAGHQLSYKAREGACHAIEDYVRRLRENGELLKTHCYRATLETVIRDTKPELRRAGIQTIKKAHLLPFSEYARLGLARVGLPPDLPLDGEKVEARLKQQNKVVVFFSLALLLAPVVETLVLLDRMVFLQEHGFDSQLVPLFDPDFSPRNFVLVALKPNVEEKGKCSLSP